MARGARTPATCTASSRVGTRTSPRGRWGAAGLVFSSVIPVNGTLDARETGLNWVGSYSAYGINAVFFENYWNTGSPVAQERYFDNLVVSTQRIGC